MNKQTKLYLGIGLVAVGAYYFWNKSKSTPKANAAGNKGINYRKAGSLCHYMYGDEYMVGRVNSYDNNICEGRVTRGTVL